ncbi:MAG: MurR/RpiR family transcriptional regulator [Thermotogae bacterium]|nr:MurR/RpiR family transcriptional regulator [Thermotogota bacterium]
MISKIISIIESRRDTLTSSEKKAADFVLSNGSEILNMTVSEFSNSCKVSEATIIRFVKKLDFDSFQDFKLSIASDNESMKNYEDIDTTINREDTPQEIIKKVELGIIRAIESTTTITDYSEYVKAINYIRSAKRIEIYGVGSSGAVAKVLNYKLTRLGFPAFAIEDPHMQAISAATMKTGDLAIGISQSGSTIDVVDSLTIAKKHGATTICITDHVNSPVTKFSNIVLQTFSKENPIKTSAGRSIVAQIYSVEILAAILNSVEYEKAEKAGKETAKAVVNKLY